jgi:hypothetical protein
MADNDKRPDILYHYTDVNGFLGIIHNKEIWLSNASLMNDYMEQKWFLKKADELLLRSKNASNENNVDILLRMLHNPVNPYIACFSSCPDLLSQWTRYCDNATGFAIGFSTLSLSGSALSFQIDTKGSAEIKKVVYDNDSQNEILNGILLDGEIDRLVTLLGGGFYAAMSLMIYNNAITCKNPGFAEEQEWRVMFWFSLKWKSVL